MPYISKRWKRKVRNQKRNMRKLAKKRQEKQELDNITASKEWANYISIFPKQWPEKCQNFNFLLFCPKCGNSLVPTTYYNKSFMHCKCGFNMSMQTAKECLDWRFYQFVGIKTHYEHYPLLEKLTRRQGYENYRSYLQSSDWLGTKIAFREMTIPVCYVCGQNHNLDLHHNRYENLGVERETDLVWLCRLHHKIVHYMPSPLSVAHIYLKDYHQNLHWESVDWGNIESIPDWKLIDRHYIEARRTKIRKLNPRNKTRRGWISLRDFWPTEEDLFEGIGI